MNYNPYCEQCDENKATHHIAMKEWKSEKAKRIQCEETIAMQAVELERLKNDVEVRNGLLKGCGDSMMEQEHAEHVYFTLVQDLKQDPVGAALIEEWKEKNNEGREVKSAYIIGLEKSVKEQKKTLLLVKEYNLILMRRLRDAGIAIPRKAAAALEEEDEKS